MIAPSRRSCESILASIRSSAALIPGCTSSIRAVSYTGLGAGPGASPVSATEVGRGRLLGGDDRRGLGGSELLLQGGDLRVLLSVGRA